VILFKEIEIMKAGLFTIEGLMAPEIPFAALLEDDSDVYGHNEDDELSSYHPMYVPPAPPSSAERVDDSSHWTRDHSTRNIYF
jgi:hypothetical protein